MKQVTSRISTYSSDEFGICSALFELGGMVVMHDASGCNSTYTTHDEPRWYDMDSMIFISAISEMEAVMGDDEKLIEDITNTAKKLHPAFIAIVGAPIPYMTGIDFPAIARLVEERTGLVSMGFDANGMQDYVQGISMALETLAKRFCIPQLRDHSFSGHVAVHNNQRNGDFKRLPRVNILGATPLDFALNGSVESIKEWIQSQDLELGTCFCMGSSLEQIQKAGEADVNLVVSYGGLAAAQVLREYFGMPFVVGVPFGEKYSQKLAGDLHAAMLSGENKISWKNAKLQVQESESQLPKEKKETYAIVGESVFSCSLATAIEMEYPVEVRVLCPVTTDDKILRKQDQKTPEEDDLMRLFPKMKGIIADPLYQVLCEEGQRFYPLPHEAFSGRIYDAVNPDLIEEKTFKKRKWR